jgi:hypothetical protein
MSSSLDTLCSLVIMHCLINKRFALVSFSVSTCVAGCSIGSTSGAKSYVARRR